MEERMTNRQRAALETRRKLIDAAKKIVCGKGIDGTSIEEITKAAGVANGTFYTYFKRKEDIVYALCNEVYIEIYEDAKRLALPFPERLKLYMERFSDYIEKSGLKLCQDWVRNTVDPTRIEDEASKNKLPQDISSLEGLFRDGIERGELLPDTPVEVIARNINDILYGEMLCWDMSGGAYSFRGRTEEFTSHFLGNLIKPYLKGDIS